MRSRAALPFLALLGLFAGLAYLGLRSDGAGAPDLERQREDLLAYEEAFEPIGVDAGRAVVTGLRAELTELSEGARGRRHAENLTAWGESLRHVKARLEDLDPPGFLEELHEMRLDSLDTYIEIARRLAVAVDARGQERERRLDAVPPLGNEADRLWDDAEEIVNDHRRRLGLPVVTSPVDA